MVIVALEKEPDSPLTAPVTSRLEPEALVKFRAVTVALEKEPESPLNAPVTSMFVPEALPKVS